MREERRERVRKIVAKLEALGVEISFEDVVTEASGDALGRPHVARALVTAGHASSVAQAFDSYIGNRGPAYVGRTLLSLEDGIEAIRRAGGVSVIAHPGSYRDWARVERMLHLPVNGVEVWHPAHKKADRKRAKRLGGRYNKVLTGGSDFHGPRGDYNEMGSSSWVTERVVTRIQEVIGERTLV